MSRPTITVEFDSFAKLKHEFDTNLKNGGTFISAAPALKERDECDIALIHPVHQQTLHIPAKVVWLASDESGIGVAFINFSPERRTEIESFVFATESSPVDASVRSFAADVRGTEKSPLVSLTQEEIAPFSETDPNPDSDPNAPVHLRLRNLPVTEQLKVARSGNANERIALERIYGKSVWEALLHNNKLTIPEVARIARMGVLPKPLMETIVSNASWIGSAPVRRALLTNPRLSREQAVKVLRAMPSTELRLVPRQMGYTSVVREAARRLLKG